MGQSDPVIIFRGSILGLRLIDAEENKVSFYVAVYLEPV